jgi:hypothetical protein
MIPERNPKFNQPFLLLGHQNPQSRLREALDRWHIHGTVGLVSAGWEEDEDDDAWVREAVGRPVVNAQLFDLAERLFAEDPEVIRLLRQRQDELRRLREVNKVQMLHLLSIARDLLHREFAGEDVLVPTQTTFQQLQQVDHEYLELVTAVIRKYDKIIDPWQRPSVRQYRLRVLERLHECQALLIAGGHLGVLLNRLNLCRLLRHAQVPLIAWSGGAMALGDKAVFFHHFPPHGMGDTELSRSGMRWYRGMLVFPRCQERLNLKNRVEMALLARRFGDDLCLALDHDSWLEWSAEKLSRSENVQCIQVDGRVGEFRLV